MVTNFIDVMFVYQIYEFYGFLRLTLFLTMSQCPCMLLEHSSYYSVQFIPNTSYTVASWKVAYIFHNTDEVLVCIGLHYDICYSNHLLLWHLFPMQMTTWLKGRVFQTILYAHHRQRSVQDNCIDSITFTILHLCYYRYFDLCKIVHNTDQNIMFNRTKFCII